MLQIITWSVLTRFIVCSCPQAQSLKKSIWGFFVAMVKRVAKSDVLKFAKAKAPNLEEQKPMSFKEVKRRSIISGLRALKAPAAP